MLWLALLEVELPLAYTPLKTLNAFDCKAKMHPPIHPLNHL
jgi:hypothetical protein